MSLRTPDMAATDPAALLSVKLGDHDFREFQQLIYQLAGIHIGDAKKALVSGRLNRRLRHYGYASFSTYLERVRADAAERQVMVDLLTTNETYFFREPRHFDLLRDQLVPSFAREREIRIWSAASSTGEEPYSLAMTLADLRGDNWFVLGTDISTRVLATARTGVYPLEAAERIPKGFLSRFCLKGVRSQEGNFSVAPALRDRTEFRQLNLNGEWPDVGRFHIIFLRNVMIYFNRETKMRLVDRLADRLVPRGYLVVGHAESLNGISDRFEMVVPSVYRRQ